MAEKFVTPIAEAIRELDGNAYPLDHYLMYGWEGLEAQAQQGYYDNNGQFHQLTRDDLNALEAKRVIVNNNSGFNNNTCQE